MGPVYRPRDLGGDYGTTIENAIKYFSPDTKVSVIKLFKS